MARRVIERGREMGEVEGGNEDDVGQRERGSEAAGAINPLRSPS